MKPYDTRRNLEEHKVNLKERKDPPEGDCTACASVQCLFNITPKKVLKLLEENPLTESIKQYSCADIKEDPVAMSADLRHID